MPHVVGLDVSKRTTSIAVIDQGGVIVDEGVVDSDVRAIAAFLRGKRRPYALVGMESWSMAPVLFAGLGKKGLPVVCIEA